MRYRDVIYHKLTCLVSLEMIHALVHEKCSFFLIIGREFSIPCISMRYYPVADVRLYNCNTQSAGSTRQFKVNFRLFTFFKF